jgi:2,3-bisphosphoglycerate-dependent phosphoglycerate mutase
MRLIPVRHGETLWNVEGREMGQLDSPLTPLGVEQAQRLARRLSGMKIDVVYSSNLGRALDTAAIIAAACHTDVRPDPGLRERNMGIFQGLTQAEIERQYPVEGRAYAKDQNYAIPNGESGPQRAERSIRAFSAIAERHPHDTVVAVTHSGLLRGFFEWVLGIPPDRGVHFRRDHASYNALDFESGKWTLVTWNDLSHLDLIL